MLITKYRCKFLILTINFSILFSINDISRYVFHLIRFWTRDVETTQFKWHSTNLPTSENKCQWRELLTTFYTNLCLLTKSSKTELCRICLKTIFELNGAHILPRRTELDSFILLWCLEATAFRLIVKFISKVSWF